MRADMTAAYLDYRDTRELARGVARGEAPPPSDYHGIGRSRQPIWSKIVIDHLTGPRKPTILDGSEREDLASLA